MLPCLVVHGGAWNLPEGDVEPHRRGIETVLEGVWPRLEGGATALDIVEAAVRLLEDDPTFNAGHGARLSREGTVELDAEGRLAAATSTGGTQDKARGRVGDSAVIGAGTYADGRGGALSCTGHGESILRVTLARWTVDRLVAGRTAQEAATDAMGELARVNGRGGLIVVDRHGGAGFAYNTRRMARGVASRQGLRVGVDAPLDKTRMPTPGGDVSTGGRGAQ